MFSIQWRCKKGVLRTPLILIHILRAEPRRGARPPTFKHRVAAGLRDGALLRFDVAAWRQELCVPHQQSCAFRQSLHFDLRQAGKVLAKVEQPGLGARAAPVQVCHVRMAGGAGLRRSHIAAVVGADRDRRHLSASNAKPAQRTRLVPTAGLSRQALPARHRNITVLDEVLGVAGKVMPPRAACWVDMWRRSTERDGRAACAGSSLPAVHRRALDQRCVDVCVNIALGALAPCVAKHSRN
jgi:hypothetical protein